MTGKQLFRKLVLRQFSVLQPESFKTPRSSTERSYQTSALAAQRQKNKTTTTHQHTKPTKTKHQPTIGMQARDVQPLLLSSLNIRQYLDVHTVEMLEESISRFRNTSVLFDSFQAKQNFLPVADASSHRFFLVARVQANALLKKRNSDCHRKFQ